MALSMSDVCWLVLCPSPCEGLWRQSLLYFNIAVNSLLHVNSQEISDRGKLLASGVCMCEQLSMAIHARMFPICQGLANHV